MEAILDYMRWVKSIEEQKRGPSSIRHTRILTDFLIHVIHKGIKCKEMFTPQTLEAFRTCSGYKGTPRAIRALSDYLFGQGRIDQPLQLSKIQSPLPDIYENYLRYLQQSRQACASHLRQARTVLGSFHKYLKSHELTLAKLNIEHLEKTGTNLNIPLNDDMQAILADIRKEQGLQYRYVFTENGKRLSDKWVARRHRKACVMAGIKDFQFKGLRHTFGTQLGYTKQPLKVIQRLMGHKNPKTTMKYVHEGEEQLKEATGALNGIATNCKKIANKPINIGYGF